MFSKKEEARKEKYKTICGALELKFLDQDEFGTKAYLKSFKLFKHTRGKIRNLSQKKSHRLDEEISLFDYKYTITAGKSSVTYDQTVFFVNSKNLGLPDFILKPERIDHKIAAFLGWEDINFETYPAFSDKYFLKGEDEQFIRHHFNDEVLKFFSKTSGWTVEAVNYYLIFYAHNSLVPENILADFYRLGHGVYDLFKHKDNTL